MTGKRVVGIVVVVVLVAGLAAARLMRVRDKESAPVMVRTPVVVEVAAVRRGTLPFASGGGSEAPAFRPRHGSSSVGTPAGDSSSQQQCHERVNRWS